MNAMFTAGLKTSYGKKSICVFANDVLEFDEPIDILTTSAFYRDYIPVQGTLFGALNTVGISAKSLAQDPEIDLRNLSNVWLSKETSNPSIRRIGCIEMIPYLSRGINEQLEQNLLRSITTYFQMLDIASTYGIKMNTVALPLLGSGNQNISSNLTLFPILNECYNFLKRNASVKRIYFIERNQQKAFQIAQMLSQSYTMAHEKAAPVEAAPAMLREDVNAFISYSSLDKNVADNLYAKLQANGVKAWYAPHDMHADFASQIAIAISKSTHFIVILSKNSMKSQHVLNEIDLAFKKLPDHIRFMPLRIDDTDFAPAFDYYLSRQHWTDAFLPPLEVRLNEFVGKLIQTL